MFIEDLLGVIFSFWTALAVLIIIVVKSSIKFVANTIKRWLQG